MSQGLLVPVARKLARACKQAYDAPDRIKAASLAAGFTSCHVPSQNGSQAFIASDAHHVLLSFRGTEATFGQWLRNLDVIPVPDALGSVHGGFSAALDEIWPDLSALLDEHGAASKPIHLTGHSLGAAMAALCAARMDQRGLGGQIEAIITFGQPKLAASGFQPAYDSRFGPRTWRVINGADIVTRVPPGYDHVGVPKRLTSSGTLEATGFAAQLQPPAEEEPGQVLESDTSALTLEQFELLKGFVEALPEIDQSKVDDPPTETGQEGLFNWATDHRIDSYIEKLDALPDPAP